MNIQDQAVKIIQSYGAFRKSHAFMLGMSDYRNGVNKDWLMGYDAQCYDRGQECQMRINRMMEGA